MTLTTILVVAAALIGIGVYGALSQQSLVMIMMGYELILGGVMLAGVGGWSLAAGGEPQGQVLVIVALLVMAVEAAIGFAVVVNAYRARQADTTEAVETMRR